METYHLLFEGIILGILVSAPLGPIGVLTIQRTINKGRRSGMFTGLGALTADIFYASLAGFGISIITDFISNHQTSFRIGGGFVLLFLAYKIFFTNVPQQVRNKQLGKNNYFSDFISTFILTLSNPLTIIFFGLAYASIGVKNSFNIESLMILIGGISAGAALWWFGLVSIISIFKKRFKLRQLWWINKITGTLIAVFSIFIIISVFFLD
jgi:threonine/homoserine/homoserine lactone efflux protein